MCELDKKPDNCNFTFIKSRNRYFIERNYKVCKYKLRDILGCFHYILNAPHIYIFFKLLILVFIFTLVIPLFHTGPESHELTNIWIRG